MSVRDGLLIESVAKEICLALGEAPLSADRTNNYQPRWLHYETAARGAIAVIKGALVGRFV